MNSLSVTITNIRAIDGLVQEAYRVGQTPEAYALQQLEAMGLGYAESYRIGVMTSAAFIARFTPTEYANIIAASANPDVANLIEQLTSSPNVAMDDPRLEPGLTLLAGAGLIAPERVPGLLAYDRPE